MKQVLSEFHQKHVEEMGRQQAEHEKRVLALVKGNNCISAGNAISKPVHIEPKKVKAQAAANGHSYLPKEFVSNEAIQTQSKQARTPSKENSGGFDSIMGVPGPSAQKPKAAA